MPPAKIIQLPAQQQGNVNMLASITLIADATKLCRALGADIAIQVEGEDHASETIRLLFKNHGVLADD